LTFSGRRWCAVAAERGNALLMELRVVDRPAFLLHTLGTKARIAANRLLVLLALTYVAAAPGSIWAQAGAATAISSAAAGIIDE
jgi:hypothetical protein